MAGSARRYNRLAELVLPGDVRFAVITALFTVPLLACDPPCPSYWQFRCESCGPESPACEHAKFAAKNELSESGQCEKLSNLAKGESSFSQARYCELHKNETRSLDELRGPWNCGLFKLDFKGPASESKDSLNPQQLVVDGKATKIWNVRTSSFQIEGSSSCHYWLLPHEESDGKTALAVSCPKGAASLTGEMLRCVRQ